VLCCIVLMGVFKNSSTYFVICYAICFDSVCCEVLILKYHRLIVQLFMGYLAYDVAF
jgi:hypothetical protein